MKARRTVTWSLGSQSSVLLTLTRLLLRLWLLLLLLLELQQQSLGIGRHGWYRLTKSSRYCCSCSEAFTSQAAATGNGTVTQESGHWWAKPDSWVGQSQTPANIDIILSWLFMIHHRKWPELCFVYATDIKTIQRQTSNKNIGKNHNNYNSWKQYQTEATEKKHQKTDPHWSSERLCQQMNLLEAAGDLFRAAHGSSKRATKITYQSAWCMYGRALGIEKMFHQKSDMQIVS